MKRVFLCPNCYTVYIYPKGSGKKCSTCGHGLLSLGIDPEIWESMTAEEKTEARKDAILQSRTVNIERDAHDQEIKAIANDIMVIRNGIVVILVFLLAAVLHGWFR